MQSAVEADLGQLGVVFALQRRFNPEIDTTEIAKELSERLREELDYRREARNTMLYGAVAQERAADPGARYRDGTIDRAAAHHDLA